MTIDLEIQGMSCGGCVASVKKALAAVPGLTVTNVQIGGATVEGDAVSIPTIKAALDDAGFAAEVRPA